MMLAVAAYLVSNHLGVACLVFFGFVFIGLAMTMYFVVMRDNQLKVFNATKLLLEKQR